MTKVRLVLEDGSFYEGYLFGSESSVSGEVVFHTAVVGYPEAITDPSYFGQILVLTYPLIGNYGVPNSEKDEYGTEKNFESDKIQVKALIVSDYSKEYHHHAAKKSLGEWLKEHNIPGIYGIDTRALTRKLREKGVMLGKVGECEFYNPNKENLAANVSCKDLKEYGNSDLTIVVVDCGVENDIIRSLLRQKVKVIVAPWDYDFLNLNFDGAVISNGPGDPKMCKPTIENVKKCLEKKIPTMGVCLGNQILALAAGCNTYKLKYGHRSATQPCIKTRTKICYVTPQNHGYAIDKKTLPEDWEIWLYNANDDVIEGIKHSSGLFYGVDFHPETSREHYNTEISFAKFVEMVRKNKK